MEARIRTMLFVVVALVLLLASPVCATLTTIGTASYNGGSYKLIYDNDSLFGPIVWLDYSHDGAGQWGGDSTWSYHMAWAGGLNTAGVLTCTIDPRYSVTWGGDWRLPSTYVDAEELDPYVYNYNITSSEMGHLFYTELGNKGDYDTSGNYQEGGGLTNTGDFDHLHSDWYWSGTESADPPDTAWLFVTRGGFQTVGFKECDGPLGLAVRPVLVAPVPEPSTMLLLGCGLAALAGCRLRRRDH